MKVPFRQGLVSFARSGNTVPQYLRLAANNTVDLVVNGSSVIAAVAHGQSDYAIIEPVSVQHAWGPLKPNVNYWLYWDLDVLTGARTFGATMLPPVVKPVAPPSPLVDQHWFDTTTTTMKVFMGSSWSPKIRVFAGYVESNQVHSYGQLSQVGIVGARDVGRIMYDAAGKPLRKKTGEFFTTEDTFLTYGSVGQAIRMECAVTGAQAEQPMSRFSIVKYTDFDKISLASYDDIGNTTLAIVTDDLNVGDVGNVVFSGTVTNASWNWPYVNASLWINDTGELISRPDPSAAIKPPIAYVVGKQSIMFHPSAAIASATVSQSVPSSGTAQTVDYVAGEILGGHRAVVLENGVIRHADNSNINNAQRVFGITTGSAAAGGAAHVQVAGEIEEPTWNWDLSLPIYLGREGLLTQIAPEWPASFIIVIAKPVTPTKIFISIREPIALLPGE